MRQLTREHPEQDPNDAVAATADQRSKAPAGDRALASTASCADWFRVVEPHLPAALVDDLARRRLALLGSRVPGDCLAAIELRLAAADSRVDLSMRLDDPGQAQAMALLVEKSEVRHFLTGWAAQERLRRAVPSLWLEFDLDQEPAALPAPGLWAEIKSLTSPGWLTGELFPALRGRPLSSGQLPLVERSLALLPAGVALKHVASMHSRAADAVRLQFHHLSLPAIVDYLRRLGAVDQAAQVSRLTPWLAGAGDRLQLSFDVGPEILPRIGVDFSFNRQPKSEAGWSEVLKRLVGTGLCCPNKSAAVLGWPGQDNFWTALPRWPAAAAARDGICVRCLSHCKLVIGEGREAIAKAYLFFAHTTGRGVW